MIQLPPLLVPGDLILIAAPAKAIEAEHVQYAAQFLVKAGFRVELSAHCLGNHHYFSGTVHERLADFQWAIDHPEAKAIICARGGYGCVQLVDLLDWTNFSKNPKWVVGFSDVTVFHQRLHLLEMASIHGTMPLNFQKNTAEALRSLLSALCSSSYSLSVPTDSSTLPGESEGLLIGGNLSILYSLIGTNDQVDYSHRILFIEDIGEHLYAVDRMFYAFKKAGILEQISGLIVGGMTDMKDTAVPFGMSLEELVLAHFGELGIPVVFNFPGGHIDDNLALRFGDRVHLKVDTTHVELKFGA